MSRPRAADDFKAIREAGKALGLKGFGNSVNPVDVYVHPMNSGGWWVCVVSERAKTFFDTRYKWNKTTQGHANTLDTKRWNYPLPDDFVIQELQPGEQLPDSAWGKHPPKP
jgi:hypothetical protein